MIPFYKKIFVGFFSVLLVSNFSSHAQTTIQYSYTGAVQTFTVPACVTSIQVKAWGAGGSGGGTDDFPGAVGGAGAFVQSTFVVTAGQTFTIIVGGGAGPGQGCLTCAPGGTSGWGNGIIDGGTGGNAGCSGCSGGGGGGGGGSGLYNGATPMLVAGAGGGGSGGGQFSSGAVGGAGGVNGGTVAGSCTSPGIAGASVNGIGGVGLNKGGADGGGGGGGGGGNNGGTGGGVAASCDCGACGGGGGNGFASGTGTIITNGAGQVPGNSGDPSLPVGDAVGGGTSTQGGNGYLIITYTSTPPTLIIPPPSTLCIGSSTTLTASGATTYSWSTGETTNPITVSPTTNTTYTVTGTTSIGCTGTATVTVVVTPSPVINISPSPITICEGNSTTLTASGGTTYSWSTGTLTNTLTVSPATTTTYTVTGTSGGCTGTATVTVTVDPPPVLTVVSPSICIGTSATLTGNGATTYSWSTGETTNPITVTPATTTTYTLTGTTNGCTGTTIATVTVNPLPTITVNSETICLGTSATLTGAGGTSYSWSTGATSNSITVSPISTTSYTVTGTDANGCTGSAVATVTVGTSLTITASSPSICSGSSISLSASGGTTYSWSNGSTTNPITVSPTTTTSYTVTGTSSTCSGTASVTVSVDVLKATAAGFPATCSGSCNGYAEVIPTAGTLPYTYSWTPGGYTTANANNLCAGNYCIKVSDANGCSVDTCVTITEPTALNFTITSSTNDSCFGLCDGTANSLTTGGTAPYTYSWNTTPSQTTPGATGLCASTYTVTLTDANACTKTASVIITQPTQVTVTPSAATTICIGQSTTLSATANGGIPAYNYSWNGIYNGQNYTVSPTTSPTTYTIIATDANGCQSTPQTVTVTINPPLSVTAKNDTSFCLGGHATIIAQGSGGNGNYNYVWQPGAFSGSTINFTPITTTTYTVTVTDNCGTPSDSNTVTVTVNPLPTVSFSADNNSGCYPLCVTFTNTSTPASASANWEFGDGNSASSVPSAINCYQTAGHYNVTLTVSDNLGCSNTSSINNMITVYPHPTANFSMSPTPITIVEPTVYFTNQSTGGVNQWEWNLGDVANSSSGLENPQYTYPDTGYYNVQLIVVDSNGCKDSITKTVYVEGQFLIYVPNAFTPNNDGINDVFYPKGTGIDPDNYQMYIFDRWGNIIFHTSNLNQGWDGRVNSTYVPVGVYVWKIILIDFKGNGHTYIGHVSVIR